MQRAVGAEIERLEAQPTDRGKGCAMGWGQHWLRQQAGGGSGRWLDKRRAAASAGSSVGQRPAQAVS